MYGNMTEQEVRNPYQSPESLDQEVRNPYQSPDSLDREVIVLTSDQSKEELQVQIVDSDYDISISFIGVNRLPTGALNIGDFLAGGAFGQVFRGTWGERQVALKKIDFEYAAKKLDLDKEQILDSLSWEVARLSTVTHPNIVQFYGIYQHEIQGYTYLVMEFCEGGELRKVLQKNADIPWSKRWQWALELSEGLVYLHNQGILHRDLKAENVLLDRNGRAKLADLGVAQVDALLAEEEARVVDMGMQDKRFIAPENIANQRLSSKATDVYALGLVFWEISSGKEPRLLNELEYLKDWAKGNHIEREPIPVNCPAGFRDLILLCWSKEPKTRPSAEELVEKLNLIAPEFNENHDLLQSCQQLEKLIHPKRKEGLSYVAPFVTEHKVEESMESYWSRWEGGDSKEAKNPPLKLDNTFKEFIETPGAKTLLLLGEAGLGKTLTTYLWADHLLQQWWAYTSHNKQTPAYFPLFIRPSVNEWTHKSLKGAYHNAVKKYNIPKDIPTLVFVDGYDECQMDEVAANLVYHLGLSEVANAKLIVTCRPNAVDRSELRERFSFKGQLQTRYFLPFSVDQLLGYLKEQLSWKEEKYQEYKKTLESAPSVRTVLRNPFVLYLMRQSWETISKKPLYGLNRWQIYEGFVEHIIEQQKGLLSEGVQERLQGNHPSLLRSYQAFASSVAFKAFQNHNIKLKTKEAASVESEWLKIEQHVEADSEYQFTNRKADGRRTLLSKEDYINVRQKNREQLEGSLPLKLRSGEYEYSHKSLFEYFMAKRLILLKDSDAIIEEGMKLLLTRPIQEERESLQFWEEAWQEKESMKLKKPLFKIIEYSREDKNVWQASSNAATLLASARMEFSGQDLNRVIIKGADLSSVVLSHTCLNNADLQDVILRGAYLGDVDLRGASLEGVIFGEHPSLKCSNEVKCISYSKDGSQMAVGLEGGNIEIYNKDQEHITLNGHTDYISSIAFHDDDHRKQLASASYDGMVGIWDSVTYQLITMLKGHTDYVNSVAWRPYGKQLASGSSDNTVVIWDSETYQLITTLEGHAFSVTSVAYSPNGKQLASGSEDRTVGIWDSETGLLITMLKGHLNFVMSVAYSPDGKQLASSSSDKNIFIWDSETYQLITILKGHTYTINSIVYSPDGKQMASASVDKMVGIWDINTYQLITMLKGHTSSVTSVAYSPDGKQLASGSDDQTVGIWDSKSHQVITTLKGHSNSILSVAWRPDGKQLASGSEDNAVGIWDSITGQLVTTLKNHTSYVNGVAWRFDGKQLASGSSDATVSIWDSETYQLITTLKDHTSAVLSVAWRPDGKQLASGSSDNTVGIWDGETYQLITTPISHKFSVRGVAWRFDGKQLASASVDNTVGIWDSETGQLLTLNGHTSSVRSVAWSPNGKRLASGCDDNTVGIWDSVTGQLITTLNGHASSVNGVAWCPDGKQLASGSKDTTVGIWDSETYQLIATLKGHTSSVMSVEYSPDGKQLISGSYDSSIFLWARQSLVYISGNQEKWQLIHRFESSSSLSASSAYLKGAIISKSNLLLLQQRGASIDQDPR